MTTPSFEIDDEQSFDENISKFGEVLSELDPLLGPVLLKEISSLAEAGDFDRDAILGKLLSALQEKQT